MDEISGRGKKKHRFLILQRITANSFLHVRQRENVRAFLRQKQKEEGYQLLEDAIKEKKSLKPGDKVYVNQMGKSIAMFIIGKESLEKRHEHLRCTY